MDPSYSYYSADGTTSDVYSSYLDWTSYYSQNQLAPYYPTAATIPVLPERQAASVPTHNYSDGYWNTYPTEYYPLPSPSFSSTPLASPMYPMTPAPTTTSSGTPSPIYPITPTPPATTSTPGTPSLIYPPPQPSSVTPAPRMLTKREAQREKKKSLVCTNCATTETCRWRNISKPNVLCNSCFVYKNKYKKTRPFQTLRNTKKADTPPC